MYFVADWATQLVLESQPSPPTTSQHSVAQCADNVGPEPSAARILPSRSNRGTVLGDLSGYVTLVDSNNFDIKSAIPLVERVVKNAPDVEIWNAVFDLVAHTSPKPITPPTALERAIFDTPLRSSSASQRGIEQTHDEVD